MIEADTTIHRGPDPVSQLSLELARRYGNPLESVLRAQASKRVALEFRCRRLTSWDHWAPPVVREERHAVGQLDGSDDQHAA
jgi:hypothetical protein